MQEEIKTNSNGKMELLKERLANELKRYKQLCDVIANYYYKKIMVRDNSWEEIGIILREDLKDAKKSGSNCFLLSSTFFVLCCLITC